jgi:hypothetical protein
MATPAKVPDDPGKRKRLRSPAYPFINLETAIKRAKEFYDKEQRNAAALKVAVKHWGFEEKSSGGLQTVAALISFGLMRDEGTGDKRKLKLTENALRILLDTRADSEDRADAIRTAALTPKIHQQLWRKWHNKIPSDDNFRHTLILDWTSPFNPSVVDSFIKQYRDTIAFAKPDDSAIVPLGGDDLESEMEDPAATGARMQGQVNERSDAKLVPLLVGSKPVGSSIPVTENCVMSISASGEVTQKGIAQLIAYLNLIKGSFPN